MRKARANAGAAASSSPPIDQRLTHGKRLDSCLHRGIKTFQVIFRQFSIRILIAEIFDQRLHTVMRPVHGGIGVDPEMAPVRFSARAHCRMGNIHAEFPVHIGRFP